MSQQQPNPDLIQIQDDMRSSESTSPTTNNNNNNNNRPNGSLIPNQAKIALNLVALVVFLFLTLYKTERQQLFALTALVSPVFLILKLAHDKGGFKNIPFAQMLTRFTVGFVLLLPVMIILCVLFVGLLMSLFGEGNGVQKTDEHQHQPQHPNNQQYEVPATTTTTTTVAPAAVQVWDIKMMIFIVSLVTAEELVKLFMYVTQDKRSEMKENPVHFIYYGLSTALGLVCAEIFFAVREISLMFYGNSETNGDGSDNKYAAPSHSVETSQIISLVIVFSGFLIPMQMIASYYIGLAAARVQVLEKSASREFPLPLFVCILFRTMFLYCVALIVPANYWAGIGLSFSCYGILVWIVLRYQDGMPREYLKQTGSLNILGYGVIAGSEDEVGNEPPENAAVGEDEDNQQGTNNNNNNNQQHRREIHREIDERTGQETKIEIVLPPLPTIGANSSSVRTMFDTTNEQQNSSGGGIHVVYEDDAEEGEELHDIK